MEELLESQQKSRFKGIKVDVIKARKLILSYVS